MVPRILVIAIVIVALVVLATIPAISTPATPQWEVWVVDESGHPLQGMTVRLSWQNYSVETEGHEEDRQTDENGYVVFPERRLNASLLSRLKRLSQLPLFNVHSGSGPHAFVFTFGNRLEGDAVTGEYITDWTGAPNHMQSRIIAKPSRSKS